ncbi:MAG: Calx-beta domain-containing protein [Verrucomicrobiales bacterium]
MAEGAGSIEFTVELERVSDRDVTVDYATISGTAIAGADVDPAVGTLTIPAGDTTGTITVPILEDNLVEPQETFTVELSNASEAGLQVLSAIGTIIDNDVTSFVMGDVDAAEASGERSGDRDPHQAIGERSVRRLHGG